MNCILSNEERNKIYKKYKEKFRDWVLGKLIDVLNNYSNEFKDNYEKISEENIFKKFNNNNNNLDENIIFDSNDNKDFENNNISNIDNDLEELEKNNIIDDINTIPSIEINNIKITNENNYIKNINISNSNNNDTIKTPEKNLNKEELISEQKTSKKDNNFFKNIKSKIKMNEKNIILVIIIILILIMFLLSFLKCEKILINIINLICLGLALFLLIKR